MSDKNSMGRGFGYWLNIFANLAVVAGIIFLAVEVRQNSQMMKAQIRNELAQSAITQIELSMRPDVIAALLRGENRSAEEELLLAFWARALLRGTENSFYQYRVGLYEEEEYAGERQTLQGILGISVIREFWDQSRGEFSREYQALVDSLIAVDR